MAKATMDESETTYDAPTRRSLDEVPVEENPKAVKELERLAEEKRGDSVGMEAVARQVEKKRAAATKKSGKRKKKKKGSTVPPAKKGKRKDQLPDEYKSIQYYRGEEGTTFQYRDSHLGYLTIERQGHKVQVPWKDLMMFLTKEVIAKRLHARIDELTPDELLGIPNLVLYPPDVEMMRKKLKKPKSTDPGEVFEQHLRQVRDRPDHKFPTIKDPPSFMRRRRRKKEVDFSGLVMTQELLDILGIKMPTLFKWRNDGFFPNPRKVENKNFWPKEVVKDWLRTHYKRGGRWYSRKDKDPQTIFKVDWAKTRPEDAWEELTTEAAMANFDLRLRKGDEEDE
jgi:predicted DNA-binding transcriptional regulator AlpA